MTTNLKINNHYIPQMILKNFKNTKGTLYEFNILKGAWSTPNGIKSGYDMTTKAIGKEKNLYTQINQENVITDDLENKLANIESKLAPLVAKLIGHTDNKWFSDIHLILNDTEYTDILLFLALGYLRTPAAANDTLNIMAITELLYFFGYVEHEKIDMSFKKLITETTLDVWTPHIFSQLLNPEFINMIFEELLEFQWFLVNNNTHLKFLIGDRFLNKNNIGFSNSDVIAVPIGKNKTLYGRKPLGLDSKRLNHEFKNNKKRVAFVKYLNTIVINNSSEFIFATDKPKHLGQFILKRAFPTKIVVDHNNEIYKPNCIRVNINKHTIT